jgi:hypothetical protein
LGRRNEASQIDAQINKHEIGIAKEMTVYLMSELIKLTLIHDEIRRFSVGHFNGQ